MSIIECTENPGNFSFSGNPIIFEFLTNTDFPLDVVIDFDGQLIFTSYYPFFVSENRYKVKADLSFFLRADSDSSAYAEGEIISPLDDFVKKYEVAIGDEYAFSGRVFRGGISNAAHRTLAEKGFDMFSYRLAFYHENFLFTTRTHGREINIRKSELYPFVFIHPGTPLVFVSGAGDMIGTGTFPAETVCTLDVRKVLEQFPPETDRIDVRVQGEYAFRFRILPEVLSAEKYLIRFRNSLGAFEMLEVAGCATHTPEFSEEDLHETLTSLDFYEERRSRVEHRNILEVETGYKTRHEFPFITDLLKSDEIYFIHSDGYSFRCHVTAEEFKYRNRMTEPASIKLKVREVTREQYITPQIDVDFDRLFDETFDKTFD